VACPQCGRPHAHTPFLTERAVVERILTHLRTRAAAPTCLPGRGAPGPPHCPVGELSDGFGEVVIQEVLLPRE
jgi:hypothetical protein